MKQKLKHPPADRESARLLQYLEIDDTLKQNIRKTETTEARGKLLAESSKIDGAMNFLTNTEKDYIAELVDQLSEDISGIRKKEDEDMDIPIPRKIQGEKWEFGETQYIKIRVLQSIKTKKRISQKQLFIEYQKFFGNDRTKKAITSRFYRMRNKIKIEIKKNKRRTRKKR